MIITNLDRISNRIGRAYPDVAALASNITSLQGNEIWFVSGTSASAPIFASVLNRINEERIAAGKTPVGFVNPALYANPGMFNDITAGNSTGCHDGGFAAVEGWVSLIPGCLVLFVACGFADLCDL